MAKPKTDIRRKIITAALKLAARDDWDHLTLTTIAKTAQIPVTEVQKRFAHRDDILSAIVLFFDDGVKSLIGKTLTEGSAHDRVFEVLMARFDLLQKHRKAILGISASVKRNPSIAARLLPAQEKAMQKMLLLSGLTYNGGKKRLATTGLIILYGATLYCWERDETKDMAATMATLDRHLRCADRLAKILFRSF